MKKFKILLFLFAGLLPAFCYAQGGAITVFSEDGDKFFLIINGVRQNPDAQTNVRVDGLNNETYSLKIHFEDAAKEEISKTAYIKDAATHQFVEVTFKIKKTKDGDLKMRFVGNTPIPVSYNPPPDMYVAHYGQPAQAGTVTQTTVTTTNMGSNAGNGGANISIGAGTGGGGVNLNVNISDPSNGGMNMNSTTTQTTTTQTTTNSNTGYASAPPPATSTCQYPMDWGSFKSAKETIQKSSFEDTKLQTAKTILASNCVSTDQVIQICGLFNFEDNKLNFAKFAYAKTTDPGNYFKVGNVFTFDSNKSDLNNFIAANPR